MGSRTPWQCPGALGAFWEQQREGWCSPINHQQSSMSPLDGLGDIHQWAEDLYPSTINKVHHEWRLWEATRPRPRYGEKLPSPPLQGMVDHFFQPECWLLKLSLLLYFLSTMELGAVKKKRNTWWAWQKACHKITGVGWHSVSTYVTISLMLDDGCFFPFILMNLGKLKFFLNHQIGSWCF